MYTIFTKRYTWAASSLIATFVKSFQRYKETDKANVLSKSKVVDAFEKILQFIHVFFALRQNFIHSHTRLNISLFELYAKILKLIERLIEV